jgi:two-component system, NtrC family, sensor histidine kinase HydH
MGKLSVIQRSMAPGERGPSRGAFLLRRLPTWKVNLFVFGLLIAMVLAFFYWQVQQAHQAFLGHVNRNTRIIAGVIEQNARSAVLSQSVVEEIMETFLDNTARFVDYLDSVAPFSSLELAAFAEEAGLAGIRITGVGGQETEGPDGWFPRGSPACRSGELSLRHLANDHLYYLLRPRQGVDGCIFVGIKAQKIETMQEQIGLPHLIKNLSGLAGVRHIRMEPSTAGSVSGGASPIVVLSGSVADGVVETQLSLGDENLLVGLDARPFFVRVKQLWRQFFVFGALLAGFGLFLSWVLYRFQIAYLEQVRAFERKLFQQREDATLGRAAASIAHEVKNPLNAISMGLQRVLMEADNLSDEHQELVGSMQQAVSRTNGIITGIREYARPLKPRSDPVDLYAIITHTLALYRPVCEENHIRVTVDSKLEGTISGDRSLLEEVVENLVKNAIEAQSPDGGTIGIALFRQGGDAILSVENSGFELDREDANRIVEPYFTTRTRGTGLGLAVTVRILRAHGGHLDILVPEPGFLQIRACLPGNQ